MAVTDEFKAQVAEALEDLGYNVEQQEDVISDVSEIDDDTVLPGIKVQGGTMTGYIRMKLGVLVDYLDAALATLQAQWTKWFTDRQTEWDGLAADKTRGSLISAVVRSRFSADEVEAILNNILANPDDEVRKADFAALQQWRVEAKRMVDEVMADQQATEDV